LVGLLARGGSVKVTNHSGYWGTHNDALYWGDSLAELKLYPSVINQYAELETGDCCAIPRYSVAEPIVILLSASKRVTLTEDYVMLQILLKTVVLGLAPKVVEIVSEVISDTITEAVNVVNNLLGSGTPEPEKLTSLQSNHKKSDTTKLTQYMYDFTIYAHTEWKNFNRQNPKNKKTMEELIEAINTYMGTDKSRTTLGRIWNGHVNRDDLPVGTDYFEYPSKTKDLS
jgi:hypothetical protein